MGKWTVAGSMGFLVTEEEFSYRLGLSGLDWWGALFGFGIIQEKREPEGADGRGRMGGGFAIRTR